MVSVCIALFLLLLSYNEQAQDVNSWKLRFLPKRKKTAARKNTAAITTRREKGDNGVFREGLEPPRVNGNPEHPQDYQSCASTTSATLQKEK